MGADYIAGIAGLLILVAGLVAIAALIINAVAKVKVAKYNSIAAKYNSLQAGGRPPDTAPQYEEGTWPPPPKPPVG